MFEWTMRQPVDNCYHVTCKYYWPGGGFAILKESYSGMDLEIDQSVTFFSQTDMDLEIDQSVTYYSR
jgi:hypothetical protein